MGFNFHGWMNILIDVSCLLLATECNEGALVRISYQSVRSNAMIEQSSAIIESAKFSYVIDVNRLFVKAFFLV